MDNPHDETMIRIRVSAAPRRIPELWRKTGFALATLLVCEVGARIVAPGLNAQALRDFLHAGTSGGLLHVYDWFVGGALSRGAVLAIGIMPYLSARCYMYLSRVVRPRWAALWESETGRATLTRWTRWLTGGLALVQSYGFVRFVEHIPGAVAHPGFGFLAKTMAVLTSGTIGVMLLSEQLTRSRHDDSPAIEDVQPADDAPANADRPVEPNALGHADSADRLLPPGQHPDVAWYRPRGDRAGVRREPGNGDRTDD